MRSPGFEPGSSTWQADVLNQARLRPLRSILRPFYLFPLSKKHNAFKCGADVLETCFQKLFKDTTGARLSDPFVWQVAAIRTGIMLNLIL